MKKILCVFTLFALCIFVLTGCTLNKVKEKEDENVQNKINEEDKELKESNKKVGFDDLYCYINGKKIESKLSEKEVKDLLGEPDSSEDSREDKSVFDGKGFIYGGYVQYVYGDTSLLFYSIDGTEDYKLGEVNTKDKNVEFTQNIKIGMTKDEVISKFYKEKEKIEVSPNNQPYVKMLYGKYLNNEFEENDVETPYEYAFELIGQNIVNYIRTEASNGNKYVKADDLSAELVFYFDDEEKLTSALWSYEPSLGLQD